MQAMVAHDIRGIERGKLHERFCLKTRVGVLKLMTNSAIITPFLSFATPTDSYG